MLAESLVLMFFVLCAPVGGLVLSDEKRLIKRLLEQYETVGIVGRPVYNTSETIQVFYGLALIQILDLDEKNQVLTTNVWSRYVCIILDFNYIDEIPLHRFDLYCLVVLMHGDR